MRRFLCIAALATLPLTIALPASAAPATHQVYVEDYDATETIAPGDAEPCVPWGGTFHEVRTGEISLVTIAGGPHTGEVHLTGDIDGFIEYIPDDVSLPTYSGSYREKFAGVLLELSFDDDASRVAQFRLRGVLHGTNGTSLIMVMSGKLTINGKGELVLDRFNYTCE